MDTFMTSLKRTWLWMLEPPWRHSGQEGDWLEHLGIWGLGWMWALAGIVLGAVVSPSVVQFARLSNSPYQDALVIAVAALAGFIVQFLAWFVAYLTRAIESPFFWVSNPLITPFTLLQLWPLAAVAYGIYRYLTWVGPGQRAVTIAFVGALLVKTFLIPLIKGLVTGALLRWFMRWLRGEKVKARGT